MTLPYVELPTDMTDPTNVFIKELAMGATVSAAADCAGVHRSTIYRWLNADEVFRGVVTEILTAQSDAANDRMTNLARASIGILEEGMDPSQPLDVRLRAAKAFLSRLPRQNWHQPQLPAPLIPEKPTPPLDPDAQLQAELEQEPHFRIPRPWLTKEH